MKRVTAQRMVIRHLHFVNETDDEAESDTWGREIFANVSNTEDGHGTFNVSDSDDMNMAAESSLNSMEESLDSQEVRSGLEYDSVYPENTADKTKPEPQNNDEPCDGKECGEDETENGTWPASRPLRRSSLTLVSWPTNQCSCFYLGYDRFS